MVNNVATLLSQGISVEAVCRLIENGADLGDIGITVQMLLDAGIRIEVVCRLVEKGANLGDIGINVRILLDAGIRIDLVNGWLNNKTHLNDAIVIMNQRVDLNLIGTSSEIGDFTGVMGVSANEIISRIPSYAKIGHWIPSPYIKDGMKFEWTDTNGEDWLVEMHGPDSNPWLPANSNASYRWIVRIKRDKHFMDHDGNFYKQNWLRPTSSEYDPANANATHIPIQHLEDLT